VLSTFTFQVAGVCIMRPHVCSAPEVRQLHFGIETAFDKFPGLSFYYHTGYLLKLSFKKEVYFEPC